MLEVNGKSIIQRQRDVLSSLGINEIIVVTGYHGQIISRDHIDLKYIYDDGYKVPGILRGLFCAEKEMDNGFIFSYSDIIYGQDIIKKLLKTQGDIVLVVDTDWKRHYQGRIKHPLSEADAVKTEEDRLVKIGKGVVKIDEAQGEFIGLAKFTARGVEIIKKVYHDLVKRYKKKEPFQNVKEFQRADIIDIVQELVDHGIAVKIAYISSIWTEIDTDEDLKRAKEIWK